MSTSITVHCDQQWRYGWCTAQLITGTGTVQQARVEAERRGWRTHDDGADYCPGCSGGSTRRSTVVVDINPARTGAPAVEGRGRDRCASLGAQTGPDAPLNVGGTRQRPWRGHSKGWHNP